MKKLIIALVVTTVASLPAVVNAADEYFYCGFTNLDGSGQDYAKWGKGTDFKFNKSNNRWEWLGEFTNQYIYPDGRYEQKANVSYFEAQVGRCDKEMEKIYKKKRADILKK